MTRDRYGILRPPTDLGYALSLYDDLQSHIPLFREAIERHRQEIAEHSRRLTDARTGLVQATSTLAWMLEHQADEIAAVDAEREERRRSLNANGMNIPPRPSARALLEPRP